MNVSLGERWEGFVANIVEQGRYSSASEVVREGLRLVEEREAKLVAFVLGGNCQGGIVMTHVARALLDRGRQIDLLILMEQARFAAYPGPVALLFGTDSQFNPFASMADPARVFDLAYPAGYTFDMIPGAHGGFFRGAHTAALRQAVAAMLQRVQP